MMTHLSYVKKSTAGVGEISAAQRQESTALLTRQLRDVDEPYEFQCK